MLRAALVLLLFLLSSFAFAETLRERVERFAEQARADESLSGEQIDALYNILEGNDDGHDLFRMDEVLRNIYGESSRRFTHLLPFLSQNIRNHGRAHRWSWSIVNPDRSLIGGRGWTTDCTFFNRIFALIANKIFFHNDEDLRVDLIALFPDERGQVQRVTLPDDYLEQPLLRRASEYILFFPFPNGPGLIDAGPHSLTHLYDSSRRMTIRIKEQTQILPVGFINTATNVMQWGSHTMAFLNGPLEENTPQWFDVTRGTSEVTPSISVAHWDGGAVLRNEDWFYPVFLPETRIEEIPNIQRLFRTLDFLHFAQQLRSRDERQRFSPNEIQARYSVASGQIIQDRNLVMTNPTLFPPSPTLRLAVLAVLALVRLQVSIEKNELQVPY